MGKPVALALAILLFFSAVYASPPSLNDTAQLEVFMDGMMAQQLAIGRIAGAEVSVVKDGRVVFSKGYGFWDANKSKVPLANETLVRPASISKLFIWTSLMQLVEQGKVDIDADVNTYLKGIQIPDTYPGQPIRVRNLLTHTAGFEENDQSTFDRLNEEGVPFGAESMNMLMPARVFPPGKYPGYSNYGASLAALIVEDVSGMGFDDYVQKNIFNPLNMTQSTFADPPPAPLREDASEAFLFNGVYTSTTDDKPGPMAPAGSLYSTADDMANFMIAHLQDGRFGGGRILAEGTARQMRTPLFTVDARMPSMCYGFYEEFMNGRRLVKHEGDLVYAHAMLVLLPDENAGIFVAYNTQTAASSSARANLMQAFMDRYYPAQKAGPVGMEGYQARAAMFEGDYLMDRTQFHDYHAVKNFNMAIPLKSSGDGKIVSPSAQYIEIAPDYFQQIDGPNVLFFKEGAQGRASEMYINSMPFMAFFRQEWYDAKELNSSFMFVLKAVFGASALAFICLQSRRKAKGLAAAARAAMAAACVAFFFYLLWLDGFITGAPVNADGRFAGPLCAVLFAAASALVFTAWSGWARCEKAHYAILVLSGLAMLAWMWHWNLFIVL